MLARTNIDWLLIASDRSGPSHSRGSEGRGGCTSHPAASVVEAAERLGQAVAEAAMAAAAAARAAEAAETAGRIQLRIRRPLHSRRPGTPMAWAVDRCRSPLRRSRTSTHTSGSLPLPNTPRRDPPRFESRQRLHAELHRRVDEALPTSRCEVSRIASTPPEQSVACGPHHRRIGTKARQCRRQALWRRRRHLSGTASPHPCCARCATLRLAAQRSGGTGGM
jgi:hypothetical protein